ncbi:MAG: hypothetical protein WBR13_09030 [Allosphingosinicella sp.]
MRREIDGHILRSRSSEWVAPSVKRIEAGSAELNVTGANDGPNQVS